MSRLIDADALLQKFNDKGIQIAFDLPVEEMLGEDVDIDCFTMLVQDAIQAYRKMVIGTIKEQPTVYDMENVVEQEHNYLIQVVGPHSKLYQTVMSIIRKGGVE